MSTIKKNSEHRNTVKIGPKHQAVIPDYEPFKKYDGSEIGETLIWIPNDNISDIQLTSFINKAKDEYHFSDEQALGLLYNYNYDFNKTEEMLSNFRSVREDWTEKDKYLFKQALKMYGKNFMKISEILPHKTTSSLVKYYYNYKKSEKKFTRKVQPKLKRKSPPKPKQLTKLKPRFKPKSQLKRKRFVKMDKKIPNLDRKMKQVTDMPKITSTVSNNNNNNNEEVKEIEIIYERILEPTIRKLPYYLSC